MGYKIKTISLAGGNFQASVSFDLDENVTVEFPSTTTATDILIKLDEIDSNYSASLASKKSELPLEIQDLVGFTKP